MNKIYSEECNWFDKGVHRAICSLAEKYDNAIPIFGGALGACEHINCDNPDFEKFTKCLLNVIDDAKFYKWHDGVVGALKTFCHICLVDYTLVEAHIGMTFEQLCEEVTI